MFRLQESINFIRKFVSELKNYAKETGRAFFFAYNGGPKIAEHAIGCDFSDYFIEEHFYFAKPWAIQKASITAKLLEDLNKKVVILTEASDDCGKIPRETKNLFKYMFADIYSNNNAIMIICYPEMYTLFNWEYIQPGIKYDLDEASKYTRFLRKHPELFHLREPAKVGVVHSFPTRRAKTSHWKEKPLNPEGELKGAIELLLDSNIPFKTIFSGDDWLYSKNKIQPAKLENLDVLILPDVEVISEEEIKTILDYVKRGGTVVQSGKFAVFNKDGTLKEDQLQMFKEKGVYEYGVGTWHNLEDLFFSKYHSNEKGTLLPTERTQSYKELISSFKSIIFKYIQPEIETTAPSTVNIRRYIQDNRVVLHLVNYDFNQSKDEFSPVQDFTVTVMLPENFVPKKAIAFDPELSKEKELEIAMQDQKATIKIPYLYAYLIVEIK